MKKIMVALTILLSVFLLFGCNNNTTQNSDSNINEGINYSVDNVISGKIPSGGVYICTDKTVLTSGDDFPEPQKGDIFQYDNYRYGFEKKYNKTINAWEESNGYIGTWSVHILDDAKNNQMPVLTEIAGKPVKVSP